MRDICEADVDFVFRLLRQLSHDVGASEEFDSVVEDVRRDALGPDPHYNTLVAEVDGRPAAIATWFFIYTTYKGKRCLHVNDLIVEDWARGHDLGRRLMARMSKIALAHDCARLDLHVHVDNAARGFYERIGMFQSDDLPYILRGPALGTLAEHDR